MKNLPNSERLGYDFFSKDVLEVAPALLGKNLIRLFPDGKTAKFIITETEAYRGEEDLACHASKGRTNRTEIMYHNGGFIYIYLIYGMYWMLNIVTGKEGNPQAVLIRGLENLYGPGKITKFLGIDKSFYGENLVNSKRIYICNNSNPVTYNTGCRIGIDYAGDIWKNKPWRFTIEENKKKI
jgi:DNA-3-methyladenine glycosylase